MYPSRLAKRTITTIPTEKSADSTVKLLSEGYLYIPNRIRKYHSELFQTRIMGQKVTCMSGKRAAELFYDQNWFTRKNAVPKRIQESLFGKKAIQTLDGAAHIHRKLLFMSIMAEDRIKQITELTQKQWHLNSRSWPSKDQIILFDEASKLLFQVACKWAGVPLKNYEAGPKSKDMSAMIDAFGAVGPRHWEGRCARNRSECWAKKIILDVRAGHIITPKDSALYLIAWHKDLSNQLLPSQTAAVELINILRPITAIATYITFGALAMNQHPKYQKKLQEGDDEYNTMYAQEIRRFYPFGTFLGARVRNQFKWKNCYFKKGSLVFLDIYGTNHDPSIWDHPNMFDPEHFRNSSVGPFDFIPQGGGDYKMGTRCPGEWLTIELIKISMDFIANNLNYQLPLQDLNYRLNRIPTLPKSHFIMTEVQPAHTDK